MEWLWQSETSRAFESWGLTYFFYWSSHRKRQINPNLHLNDCGNSYYTIVVRCANSQPDSSTSVPAKEGRKRRAKEETKQQSGPALPCLALPACVDVATAIATATRPIQDYLFNHRGLGHILLRPSPFPLSASSSESLPSHATIFSLLLRLSIRTRPGERLRPCQSGAPSFVLSE